MRTATGKVPERDNPFQLMSPDDGPQVAPILALHRGEDGFASFCRKGSAGEWENLFSVRPPELASMFPALREELFRDSYFSVNAFFRHGGRNPRWPNVGAPYRKTEGLRYLNACYADLDCYHVGLDSGKLAGIVLSAQSNGVLPPVSMFARSGRGVWLFWILEDPRTPGQPPRCWPEKMALYIRIQRALHERLAVYGADAFDAARVTRVPGSLHSGVNEPVTYLSQFDARGRKFVHTLESMARSLGLPGLPHLAPAKRGGWIALHRGRLRQFETLWEMRGGFSKGCRNRATMLYVTFMAKNRLSENDIAENARRLAAECRPPLTDAEVRAALASRSKRHRVTNQTISDWLIIRPEESASLETWLPASRFGSRALHEAKRLSRSDQMKARRDAVQRIVRVAGRVPPVREMARLLREQCGSICSWVTVASDYQSLRLISESERKRKQRKQEAAKQLEIPRPALLSSVAE